MRRIVAVMLLLVSCSAPIDGVERGTAADGRDAEAVAATCLDDSAAFVTGAGVGAVRIRMEVADLPPACPILGDTTLLLEGQAQPAVLIGVNADTVMAEVVGGKIWRARVLSRGLLTYDSIGVGTPAAKLTELADAVIAFGEGSYFVIAEESHCGLSFALPRLQFRGSRLTMDDLAGMADTIAVGEILITGACHSDQGSRILWDTARTGG